MGATSFIMKFHDKIIEYSFWQAEKFFRFI